MGRKASHRPEKAVTWKATEVNFLGSKELCPKGCIEWRRVSVIL